MRVEPRIDPAEALQGRVRVAYEAAMITLALTVAVLLAFPDQGAVRGANLAIWTVFVLDYAVRVGLSSNRRAFLRRNIPDLVAILPVDFFRIARLVRLARLLRLFRAGTVLWRVSADLRGILATNGLQGVLAVAAAVVLGGASAVWAVEPGIDSFGTALW